MMHQTIACLSHASDSVSGSHTSLGASLPGRVHQWLGRGCLQGDGFCWFCGCSEGNVCGKVPPHVSALACAGSESSVTQCPMSTGDDVSCAPEESVAMSCAGVGDPIGKPV